MTNNGIEIKIFMMRKGLQNKHIASELKIQPSAVTRFLKGEFPSLRLKKYFLSKGCPSKYFTGKRVA